jgi:hypothetical protein
VIVPSAQLRFAGSRRQGAMEPDIRATLEIPGAGERSVPVKDHHLLRRAESTKPIDEQVRIITAAVQDMGPRVAVRLGLSRGFQSADSSNALCWLMADGFFSLEDPQP